jgi:hypothetical protein
MSVGWGPWRDEPFLYMLREQCEKRRLSLLVCKDVNVERTVEAIESGRLRVGIHLNLQTDYQDEADPYVRLGYAVKDAGGMVVNDPDSAKTCSNKSIIHYQFERADIPTPYTVVVRNWQPATWKLAQKQRRRLGRPFIIKPARGWGKMGVVKVDRGSIKEIARARRFDRGDDFLLQKYVDPLWFGHKMGWFRAFYLFGEVTACWWDRRTQHYAPLTLAESVEYGLEPVAAMAREIAAATQMGFFSTEIALTGKGGKRRFLAIDYVNDPCDTTVQSFSHSGVPDCVVRHFAELLAETAWRIKQGLKPAERPSVWFAE